CRLLSGTEHAVANGMGFAWVDGRRCRRRQCGHFGGALSCADPGGGWILEGRAFYRDGLSPGLFSALSRLREIFPALGDGALPQSQKWQPASGPGGNVTGLRVIAVTGLRTEARIVAGPRVLAIAGGGDAAGLAAALEAIVARKPAAILSFGVAGGLAPGLAPGSKLIARTIIAEDGTRYDGDPVWSKRLSNALGGARITDIAGIDSPLAGQEEKHALHRKTGAHAADMESHIAARVAAAHNLPFAAFRVVVDPAHRRLPHAALVALKSDGSLAYGAIAGSILRDPRQIPQLLRIAHDAQAAFLALFRSRKLIAGTLGFTDFREFLLDVPAEDVLGGPLQVYRDVWRHRALGANTAQGDAESLHGMVERIFHRFRLEAAMDHAVGAFFVISGAIGVPVGLLHQLLEARRIAFTEKITRPLPAEVRARRIAPRRALIGSIAGEKVEE